MNNYGKNEDIYMNRKLMAAILCCVMATLTACGGKDSKKEAENKAAEAATEETAVVETYTPAVHEEGKYYVGIIQQSGKEALWRSGALITRRRIFLLSGQASRISSSQAA